MPLLTACRKKVAYILRSDHPTLSSYSFLLYEVLRLGDCFVNDHSSIAAYVVRNDRSGMVRYPRKPLRENAEAVNLRNVSGIFSQECNGSIVQPSHLLDSLAI